MAGSIERPVRDGKGMRIGWVISANKARKNRWSEFRELGRARGFVVAERPFSLEDDAEGLEEQAQALLGGLPDVVIAKFTDHLQRANAPDSSAMFGRETREKAQRQLRLWSEFQSRHPSIVVLDSPEAQTHVLDRGALSALLASLVNTCQLPPFSLPVASPKYVIVKSGNGSGEEQIEKAELSYPLVVKPLESCGSPETHLMGLVFHGEGLRAFTAPYLAQEYFNHNSVVYKVFVVGRFFSQVPRSSLRNFVCTEESGNFMFDSQGINQNLDQSQMDRHTPPSEELLRGLVGRIGELLGLTIYGFDIIQNSATGLWSIIDINFFPGFSGCVSEHHHWLLETALERIQKE